jgi:hypothetical protein
MQIIKKLSHVTRQFCKDQTEKEVALVDNRCLKRKVSKAKEVVDELCMHLKDECLEVHHCKTIITKVERYNISSTNATDKKA